MMGNIAEKIAHLNTTKNAIRQALIAKGVEVDDTLPFRQYSEKINEIKGNSGTETSGKYLAVVIDYDGSVIKSDYLNDGLEFTLPVVPDHSGLVFEGWTSPIEINGNKVAIEHGDIVIGASYRTASGKSEFDIRLTRTTGLSVSASMFIGKTSIDWGDGTINNDLSHTYSQQGNYTIKVEGHTGISSHIFGNANILIRARLRSGVESLSASAFESCGLLESVSIPRSVKSIGADAFAYCYSLQGVVIPNGITELSNNIVSGSPCMKYIAIPLGVTRIGDWVFPSCQGLKAISLPRTVENMGRNQFHSCVSLRGACIPSGVSEIVENAFNNCYSLKSVSLGDDIESIGSNAFNSCYALLELTLPNGVTSIGASAFNYCTGLKRLKASASLVSIAGAAFRCCHSFEILDMTSCLQIPTLTGTDVFYMISESLKIVVPDSLYNSWVNATNWSAYADYIYKASEVIL